MKTVYWGLGLLAAGLIVNLSYYSSSSVNGVVEQCSAFDGAKILFGGLAIAVGIAATREQKVFGPLIAVAGAGMMAYGANLFGVLCG